MQNKTFNFTAFILLAFFSTTSWSQSMNKEELLFSADSLFSIQKYTESFEIYEQIFSEMGEATPQMLMKMAYIKEGLGDHSSALFYLNKYYLKTYDSPANSKMNKIADQNYLNGYELGDKEFFNEQFNRYFVAINVFILLIFISLLAVVVNRKFKSKKRTLPFSIPALLLLVGLYWLNNIQFNQKMGIITGNHAYLMEGPSAGADLVEIVQEGHRIKIIGKEGIWYKVDWYGMEVYIRDTRIQVVNS